MAAAAEGWAGAWDGGGAVDAGRGLGRRGAPQAASVAAPMAASPTSSSFVSRGACCGWASHEASPSQDLTRRPQVREVLRLNAIVMHWAKRFAYAYPAIDRELIKNTRDEAATLARHGVRLVWVVQPETRTIDVYRPAQAIVTLGEQDALDGLDVLPGFACDVSAVFSEPTAGAVRQDG